MSQDKLYAYTALSTQLLGRYAHRTYRAQNVHNSVLDTKTSKGRYKTVTSYHRTIIYKCYAGTKLNGLLLWRDFSLNIH